MRLRIASLAILAGLTLIGPAHADSLSVGFEDGTVNTSPGIVTFKTQGSDMAGMAITFTFTDGSSATSFWAGGTNSLGDNGGVTLSLAGDTYFTQWSLTNTNKDGLGVTKMVVDAGLGNTVFDQTFGSLAGTPSSSSGKNYKPTTGKAGLDIVATYSDIVKVAANAAVGDLYRTLTVEFTNNGGFAAGRADPLKFWADTDTVEPLTTPQNVRTPAPAAWLLALLGAPILFRRRTPVV